MIIHIRGARWSMVNRKLEYDVSGLCLYDNKQIKIDRQLTGRERTDTIVHEVLHAALPDICEEAIGSAANSATEALEKDAQERKKHGS